MSNSNISGANSGSITHLLGQLQLGQDDVVERLFHFYYDQLTRIAKKHIPMGRGRVSDEEDLASQVLFEFLVGSMKGDLPKIKSREDALRMLADRLKKRAITKQRDSSRLKRGGGGVRGESAFMFPGCDSGIAGIERTPGREPLPEQRLIEMEGQEEIAKEILSLQSTLLECLVDDQLRSIASLYLTGLSKDEIMQRMGISRASFFRKMNSIKKHWETVVTPRLD